jgi:Tol biopolymer transport system component
MSKWGVFILAILALLLTFSYIVISEEQPAEVTKAEFESKKVSTPAKITGFEIIDIGTGRAPRFSPDSKKIAFLSGGWLCLANSDGTGGIQKIEPLNALDFQWMDDSTLIYWSQDFQTKERIIGTVKLKGEKNILASGEGRIQVEAPPVFLPDGTIGFYKKGSGGEKTFKVVKEGTLPPDSALKQLQAKIAFENSFVMYGDIWLVSVDGTIKKRVTTNKRFSFPELSPDGQKILAGKTPNGDPYLGQGAYVIDLKGVEVYIGDPDVWIPVYDSTGKILYQDIEGSVGSLSKWSPDGTKIVYMYQKTNYEDLGASDIVIKNADGTGRFQIETPDEMEEEPVWSPDGTMIACQTYRTNKIRIFKLK